jgi:hypothetical protein
MYMYIKNAYFKSSYRYMISKLISTWGTQKSTKYVCKSQIQVALSLTNLYNLYL